MAEPTGRVVVLGSINVDLVARGGTLPTAGETAMALTFAEHQGGKGANQAVAAARAGALVTMFGAVGSDDFGSRALGALATEGIDVAGVVRVEPTTGVALIVVDDAGENQITVVPGANALARGDDAALLAGDVVSAVLEVPVVAVRALFEAARAVGATTFLNAAPVVGGVGELLPLADVVCVNEGELAALGGDEAVPGDLVVTLGAAGMRVRESGVETMIEPHEVAVVDTVGAGDASCGAMVAGLAARLSLVESARRGNAAGALTVMGLGARSSPTEAEIDAFLGAAS